MKNFIEPKWNLLRNISKDWFYQEVNIIDFEKNPQEFLQKVKDGKIKGKFSYMIDDKKCFFVFQNKADLLKFNQMID